MQVKNIVLYGVVSVLSVCAIVGIVFGTKAILKQTNVKQQSDLQSVSDYAVTTLRDANAQYIAKEKTLQEADMQPVQVSVNNTYYGTNTNQCEMYDLSSSTTPDADSQNTVLFSDNASLSKDGSLIYSIQWLDTLCDISAQCGRSVDEIANYNEIRDVNKIYAGSVIRIPND